MHIEEGWRRALSRAAPPGGRAAVTRVAERKRSSGIRRVAPNLRCVSIARPHDFLVRDPDGRVINVMSQRAACE